MSIIESEMDFLKQRVKALELALQLCEQKSRDTEERLNNLLEQRKK
jgi:hypothetical protein